jgi:lysophospholipase L1-like esterase
MVNPRVIYLAAQHTPQMPDNADVMMLNAAMVPWAAGITTAESPVALVDLFTGINSQTDMSDGVHLNDMGSEIVSDRWFAALSPILKP